ncbi:MAG: hypothetical protein ACTSUV_06100 [Candidatus Ranarchaeia archaeon]
MPSVKELLQELFSANQFVSAAVVLNLKGEIIDSEGEWEVNGSEIIESLGSKKLPSLIVQGIKYSTFQHDEIKYIGSNMQGQGHVICAKAGKKAWIITYHPPDGDVKEGYRDVFNLSQKMKEVV